jgi:hypothetical protein
MRSRTGHVRERGQPHDEQEDRAAHGGRDGEVAEPRVTAKAASVTAPVSSAACSAPPSSRIAWSPGRPLSGIAAPPRPSPAGGAIAPSSSRCAPGARTRKGVRLTTGWPSSEMTR